MDLHHYPVIASQIRAAGIEHEVKVAHSIGTFIADTWHAIEARPVAPTIVPVDRRRDPPDWLKRLVSR
jgi:hypothetical protein